MAGKNSQNTGIEDFDWSGSGRGFSSNYSADQRVALEAEIDGTINQINERELVMGTVVGLTDKDVIINIGFKSDGLVPKSEFKDKAEDIIEPMPFWIN